MGSDSDSGGEPLALEVGIVSSSPSRLMDFYHRAFGFTESSSFSGNTGTVYKMRNGDLRLKIFAPAASPRAGGESLGEREGIGYLAVYVGALDQALQRALDAGADVVLGPMSHRPGARTALIKDPDGNTLELLEDPQAFP